MRGAGRAFARCACSPISHPPLISPTLLADDFARQLSFDELVAAAHAAMPTGRAVLWSVLPDGMEAIRREQLDGEIGSREAALMRLDHFESKVTRS